MRMNWIMCTLATCAACAGTPSPVAPSPSPRQVGLSPRPAAPPHGATEVSVTVLPAEVVIDRLRGLQRVSCDFRLHNGGAGPRTLRAIEMIALDPTGAQVSRQVIDDHGIAPAIAMIPDRAIPAGGDLYLFNPFEVFPADLALATLRFRFQLVDKDGRESVSQIDVVPRPFRPRAALALPLEGAVIVAAGNGSFDPHRRINLDHPVVRAIGMTANSARYAIDLTRVDASGSMFTGDGSRREQWHGWGAEVTAPAAGTVVAVVADVPDNKMTARGVEFAIDPRTAYFGNFVILDHGGGEVSLLAHLAQRSLRVRAGDRVVAGQQLARIGFSGNTDFVHAHYQLMSGPDPRTAEGLPIQFRRFARLLGSNVTRVDADGVQTGDIVRRDPITQSRARAP